MNDSPRLVIYCPTTNSIIDFVKAGASTSTALATYTPTYGSDLVVLPEQDAFQRYEDGFRSPPVEITAATFFEMLEVLPPGDWRGTGDTESFKLIERTAASITGIYARIGDRYFHMSDTCTLPHADIVARIKASPTFDRDVAAPGL